MSRASRHVLVLLGGASGEHSISVRSAATVVPALSRARYRVTCVAITRDGDWRIADFSALLARATKELVSVEASLGRPVALARAGSRQARLIALDQARTADMPEPFDV